MRRAFASAGVRIPVRKVALWVASLSYAFALAFFLVPVWKVARWVASLSVAFADAAL